MLGLSGWYSTNILGNRDGEVLDDPDNFKTKEESKLGVLEHIIDPEVFPALYGNVYHKVRINYYPPRGDNKEGWDNIDIFGWLGYPMQIKIDFLCRDSILAAPIVLDLALFMDLAHRAGSSGVQAGRCHRCLVVEAQPLLDAAHTRPLREVGEQHEVERERGGEDRVAAQEVDLQLHRVTEPAEDVDVVPTLFVITARRVVVNADLVGEFAVKFRIKLGLQDVFQHRQLGLFLGLE